MYCTVHRATVDEWTSPQEFIDITIIHVEHGPTQLLFAHRRAGGGTRKEEGRVLAFSAYVAGWICIENLAPSRVSYQITQLYNRGSPTGERLCHFTS